MKEHKYVTEFFRSTKEMDRWCENKDPEGVVCYIHDFLVFATLHVLDIVIVCSSLRAPFRDRYFSQVMRKHGRPSRTFADCVRPVLQKNGRVRILIWREIADRVISPSFESLIEEGHPKLDIRISGTNEHADKVPHFMLAHRSNECLALRIERPHPLRRVDDREVDSLQIPAFIATQECARTEGGHFLCMFNKWFDATLQSRETVSVSTIAG